MSLSTSGAAAVQRVLIVGAGQAGIEAAFALRQQGYAGSLTLIGEEPWLPYRRPPLSKTFLADDAPAESLAIKPAAAFDKAGIERVLGVPATAIDRATATLLLADGRRLAYDRLILATGGRARRLDLPGADAGQVFTLRGINDALALRRQFLPGRRLVVIGGGYIGLEVAALARQKGLDVTVLEAAPRLLARVASPWLSNLVGAVHADAGVDVRLHASVRGIRLCDGEVRAVACADTEIAADLVLVAVGLQPNTALAAAAGLTITNGICTDREHRSSDPNIFAVGDCAEFEHDGLGLRLRLESIPNAIEQGRRVARALLGQPLEPMPPPWFWSDQYDLKLQTVGLHAGYDQCVLRGDPAGRSVLAFYLRDGRLIAADAVNRMADFNRAKTLVAARAAIDPAALADESRPLA